MADTSLRAGANAHGHSLALQVPQAQLAAFFESFLHGPAVYGLVHRLDAALWFGAREGQAVLYAPDQRTVDGAWPETTPSQLLADWPVGRLFSPDAEWRWQPAQPGELRLLGLAEDPALLTEAVRRLGVSAAVTPQVWHAAHQEHLLVGSAVVDKPEYDRHAWLEVRMPYPLLYPVAHRGRNADRPDDRLQLAVVHYADNAGALRFTRLRSLQIEPVQEGGSP